MDNATYGTILLVEDDLSLASWVKEFLQQKFYYQAVLLLACGFLLFLLFRESRR